jgi:hypothetical protein
MTTKTEYWLQKKAFNSWSHVTWYSTIEEAQTNFNKVSVEGNGYSWRMVKVDVVEERLNYDEPPVIRDEPEPPRPVASEFKSTWGAPTPGSWGKPMAISPIKDTGHHGLSGSVWMVHFGLKKKTRVPASQMADLVAQGYVKGSPRTVL